ncbi:MAG: ribonuclease Z [Acidobacteria bacterium]|nr:ribonuclease Z [Acidobacteriota bacterium]
MQDVRVVFLGTGSATPSRERNVAAMAIAFDGRTLLFDCGEATQHQLMRSDLAPSSIEAIFITHLHGDHLYGLPGLIATLGLYGRERLLPIYGPPGLRRFLAALPYPGAPYGVEVHEAADCFGDGYRVVHRLLDHTVPCFGYSFLEDDRPGRFDVESARALGVPEGPLFGALQRGSAVTLPSGRVIEPASVVGPTRPGRRIVYCTDTRPCAASIELARDADLLVHEATYGDDMAAEAAPRGHSTAAEAARIAKAAGVRQLVLTHFSARYRDVAPLLADAQAVFPASEVAADFAAFVVHATPSTSSSSG